MGWCVITVACVLLERPSAVAVPQLVRADQPVHPNMVCKWLHKLQDVMHAITCMQLCYLMLLQVFPYIKASVLLADDCILQADCNGNVCAAVTNNASCVTTGKETICLINLLHRRAAL